MAGFANALTGGLVVVGFSTRKEHDSEVLDSMRPVPRVHVDLDRHRKLIRERVIPPPRGVSVEWIDCGSDHGLLVIDVPVQPAACLPYVVPGPTRTANVSRMSVAVPVREGDATPLFPQQDQALVRVQVGRAQGQRAAAAAGRLGMQPQQQRIQLWVITRGRGGLVDLRQPGVRHGPAGSRQAARLGDLPRRVVCLGDQPVVDGTLVQAAERRDQVLLALRPPRALRRATTWVLT